MSKKEPGPKHTSKKPILWTTAGLTAAIGLGSLAIELSALEDRATCRRAVSDALDGIDGKSESDPARAILIIRFNDKYRQFCRTLDEPIPDPLNGTAVTFETLEYLQSNR